MNKSKNIIHDTPCTARCGVCLCGRPMHFCTVDGRDYWRCPECLATFLDSKNLPDVDSERREYVLHGNDAFDPKYREFVGKLFRPLHDKLRPGMVGLDYGCGPGPALGTMFVEKGYAVSFYDPIFCPDASVLDSRYDFIICSEVVEHFHRPAREFARLNGLLKGNGWLGIMTCFQTDDRRFANWHYRRDPTHVVFYREQTFEYIAGRHGWNCRIPCKDVVLMQKKGRADDEKSKLYPL